jgi:hypothetical protein
MEIRRIIVENDEIVPLLFDPPHMIKGVRNNLITKNLIWDWKGHGKYPFESTAILKVINGRYVKKKTFFICYSIVNVIFSLLVSEGVIIDSRTDPRSRISLPRLIIIFIINQGQ